MIAVGSAPTLPVALAPPTAAVAAARTDAVGIGGVAQSPVQATGVLTAGGGMAARINAVIRQMAMNMLTNNAPNDPTATQGTTLASELVTLLSDQPANGAAPANSVVPPTNPTGQSMVPPTNPLGQSPVLPPVSNLAIDVAAGATQGAGPLQTTPFMDTATQAPIAAGVSNMPPASVAPGDPMAQVNVQLASLAQNVIQALLAQTASGAAPANSPMVTAAQSLLTQIQALTGGPSPSPAAAPVPTNITSIGVGSFPAAAEALALPSGNSTNVATMAGTVLDMAPIMGVAGNRTGFPKACSTTSRCCWSARAETRHRQA
ncbi:hypothetical protein EGW08_010997 [Elysia chlorotica]|uniref:Uncharacterized protein n=1 Tax=Elysia chlorotica TaxID=188477 RepID=A0A433TI60_ELYCH|nr:hypothetical protein EGW08_010997 [Elysia chlorotica]